MDDLLEMDASGCWVRKRAQLISETPLRLHREHYNRFACSPETKDAVDNVEQDEDSIIW